MIRSIAVKNSLGYSVNLDLAQPERTGIAVTSITGLGPGKANINTTEMSTTDGALFNSARLPVRNIVMSLKFLWKDSVEDVRQLTYKYFPVKKQVTLTFKTDNRESQITGYVESNEPDIFSKNEGATVSIICPDPFFYSVDETVIKFYTADPAFEFPFSNESLTANMLEFGKIQSVAEEVVAYHGDSEIGVTIRIHAVGSASNISVINVGTRGVMRINTDKLYSTTGVHIIAGDDIEICTIKGSKSIKLIRSGKTTNILNCLEKNSEWFQLSPGDNIFAYTAEDGGINLQMTIEYRVIYEGV